MYEKKKTLNERHLKSPDICLLKALSNYNLIHVHFEGGRRERDCSWVGSGDQWSVMEPSRCLPLELHAGMISVGVCLCMCVTELMEGHQAWGDQRGEKNAFHLELICIFYEET